MLKIAKMIINARNRSRIEPRYIHCKRCNKQIPQTKQKCIINVEMKQYGMLEKDIIIMKEKIKC